MAHRLVSPDSPSGFNDQTDRFLALLAHELRSPLGPLRTSLELLSRDAIPEETKARAREVMLRQVAAMARLIDELTDIARAGEGRMELHREALALSDLIKAAAGEVGRTLQDKALTLNLELPTQEFVLNLDRARMVQAIAALLSDAARRSDRGRKLWLRAQVNKDGVGIAILDEGFGAVSNGTPQFRLIPQPETEPDQRSDRAGGPALNGIDATLGATLARRLIELHGGRLYWHEGAGDGNEVAVYVSFTAGTGAGDRPVDG